MVITCKPLRGPATSQGPAASGTLVAKLNGHSFSILICCIQQPFRLLDNKIILGIHALFQMSRFILIVPPFK